jgi:hypothetical protein
LLVVAVVVQQLRVNNQLVAVVPVVIAVRLSVKTPAVVHQPKHWHRLVLELTR